MTRRNLELVLLCVAAPIVVLLFAMLAINQGQSLNATTLGVPIGIFVAFVIAHLAVRKFAPKADPAILPISFALSGIGIAFITRLAPYADKSSIAINQVMWLFLGVACMVLVLVLFRNLDKVANYKYTLMIVGFALLLSPLLPVIGQEIYGSRIWIGIPGVFSFQPGEIAKIAIVLFLAGYLAQNREMLSVFTWRAGPFNLPDIRTLLPLLLMWLVALLIVVFEKDLGSALVFFFVFLIMLYVATGKKFYLVVGLGLIAVGGVGAYLAFGHVQTRVDIWLDPFADAQNTGYQLVQSLYSIADGDLFGVGLGRGLAGGGNGLPQIPVAESDFIFTVIAEEIGLLGAAGVLLLFLCFAIRGFVTAARAKSDVSSFVAVGLTSIVVLQAFIIVGGITRLIPLTGITLPFISQGGSSLLASFIIVGFLLRCGDEGTGVGEEMASATTSLHANSVLGRVSLGKRLTHAMIILSTLFALLVANLTLIMVVQASYYQNMPGNNHTMAKESRTERGTISTYDGVILAQSVQQEDGTYERVYPAGNLATHVVGYASTQFGTSGIEAAENDTLKGQQNYASWTDVLNSLAGIGGVGNDVTLTLNSKIQQAAQDALCRLRRRLRGHGPRDRRRAGAWRRRPPTPRPDFAARDREGGRRQPRWREHAAATARYRHCTPPAPRSRSSRWQRRCEDGVASEDTVFSSPGTMDIGNAPVTNFNKNSYGDHQRSPAPPSCPATPCSASWAWRWARRSLVGGADEFGFNRKHRLRRCTLATSLMAEPDEMTEVGDWPGRRRASRWARTNQPQPRRAAGHRAGDGPGGQRHRQRTAP